MPPVRRDRPRTTPVHDLPDTPEAPDMPEAPWYMTESVAACIEHVRPRVAEYVERMQRMPRSHPRWAAGALAFILVFSCYCIPNLIGCPLRAGLPSAALIPQPLRHRADRDPVPSATPLLHPPLLATRCQQSLPPHLQMLPHRQSDDASRLRRQLHLRRHAARARVSMVGTQGLTDCFFPNDQVG
ncbi:hypothetical protein BU26DRAFT_119469 [Trematosphaeria pertusa]|uniref:Uncharacterized protein n=1 Tax=Trematosphaeria pertusa TaxID=390896 RepID=A0A6A6HZD2_9PLEO|nr:uncharacterized protein BU26DRAFT_119469 [Trematosphaeria pertusa]KAF2243565.1 hypothetical protein BU26DRAFT_119469 [Trematosphaeria pertusa]